jgi:hypothetical protein
MKPRAPDPSDAYKKFMASTIMDYEKWHDGIGYDLDTFKQMTPAEQARVVAELKSKGSPDWRDVEVFEIAGTAEADAALREALDHGPPEARLHAMQTLAEQGKLPDVDERLAKMLDRVIPTASNESPEMNAQTRRGRKANNANPILPFSASLRLCVSKSFISRRDAKTQREALNETSIVASIGVHSHNSSTQLSVALRARIHPHHRPLRRRPERMIDHHQPIAIRLLAEHLDAAGFHMHRLSGWIGAIQRPLPAAQRQIAGLKKIDRLEPHRPLQCQKLRERRVHLGTPPHGSSAGNQDRIRFIERENAVDVLSIECLNKRGVIVFGVAKRHSESPSDFCPD